MRSKFGLTLIELLIGLAVMSSVLLLSVYAFNSLFKRNILEVRADEIGRIVQYARSHALIEQRPLTLMSLSGTNNWSEGVILVSQSPLHPDMREVIHEWHWNPRQAKVHWVGFISSHQIQFSSDLRKNTTNGHFELYKDNHKVTVTLNRIARTTISYS